MGYSERNIAVYGILVRNTPSSKDKLEALEKALLDEDGEIKKELYFTKKERYQMAMRPDDVDGRIGNLEGYEPRASQIAIGIYISDSDWDRSYQKLITDIDPVVKERWAKMVPILKKLGIKATNPAIRVIRQTI